MRLSLYNPDHSTTTLADFLRDYSFERDELLPMLETLGLERAWFGGGGASPQWAVKEYEPGDERRRLDDRNPLLRDLPACTRMSTRDALVLACRMLNGMPFDDSPEQNAARKTLEALHDYCDGGRLAAFVRDLTGNTIGDTRLPEMIDQLLCK